MATPTRLDRYVSRVEQESNTESKMRIIYPEGRRSYAVEVHETPKGLYVGRRFASHGCLIRWSVMAAALRRAKKRGVIK